MIYNDYISASNVTLKTYLSPLESLFWNDFMGHIRELAVSLRTHRILIILNRLVNQYIISDRLLNWS